MPPFSIVGAATVTVGLIFPAFRTMQAIEQSSSGTQRWAQFWTLIGILGGIDYLFSFILHHVPLYPYLKLGIVSWLLPAENVQWAYRVCILPNLGHYQHHIDSALQQGGVMASGVVTAAAGMLPTQARSQVLRGLGQDGLATTQAARGAHAEPGEGLGSVQHGPCASTNAVMRMQAEVSMCRQAHVGERR